MPQIPTRQLHALLGVFHSLITQGVVRIIRTRAIPETMEPTTPSAAPLNTEVETVKL